MKPLRLFAPDYGPLAGQEVYRRHVLAGERAQAEGVATVAPGRRAEVEDLLLFHTPQYVEALRSGEPDSLATSGGTWFAGVLEVSLSVLGAFLDAVDAALEDGVAGLLGGGGHHACPEHGGALSPINDLGIGVHYLRRRLRRVLVLDLDVHFGNGTAAGFPSDPDLFLFDFHGHAAGLYRPDTAHHFRSFHDRPDGRPYLAALRRELPATLDAFQPEACLYLAGMDVFSGTPNAHLRLRVADIEQREAFVFRELRGRRIPVAYAHGGGYASVETVAGLHLITARHASGALQAG